MDYLGEYPGSFDGSNLDLLKLPFGVRHRVLRALLDLTLEDVGAGIGVDPYTITRWEKHGVSPQRENAEALVDFYTMLGVPAEVLSGYST